MCIHCDPGVDCAHDREADTWVVPRQPVFLPPLAPADDPQAPGGR